MAKANTVEIKGLLTAGKINAIATVWSKGINELASAGGNLALGIVRKAADCGGNKADAEALVEAIAEGRDWSDITKGIYRSYALQFLTVPSAKFEKTVDSVIAKRGGCSMESAYYIAKAINAKEDPIKALDARASKKSKTAKGKRKVAKAAPASAGKGMPAKADDAIPFAFNALIGMADLPRGFKAQLEKLASDFGYTL